MFIVNIDKYIKIFVKHIKNIEMLSMLTSKVSSVVERVHKGQI